jgi:hypothetical protein
VDARSRELPLRSVRTLCAGLLGGILGTSGMILVGVAAEAGARLPLAQILPELELGFGGPLAGAGALGPDYSLPVHYLHGAVLGFLFAGIVLAAEHVHMAPRIPGWASGLIFGAVVAAVVIGLVWVTSAGALGLGVVGLIVLLHLTFGGLTGALVQRVRVPAPSVPFA